MNRTGLRLLAVSVTLLLWGVPQVTAQQTVPPTPTAPAAPAQAPTVVTVDKIVSDALSVAGASVSGLQGAHSFVLNSRVSNGLSEKRQDIELVDVPLKEALKQILEASKLPYIIDEDVPNDPKVSIKLANAPLTAVLDALTLSNKIGWRTEFKYNKTAPKVQPTVDDKTHKVSLYAIGDTKFETQIHVGKTVAALPGAYQFRTLDIEGPPPARVKGFSVSPTSPAEAPQMRIYRWQSQKRTFTCPHCHNSISILPQPEEVRCSKCRRPFETNWQVCPFDGTKRPERKDAWRFCPICGKTIKMETSWSAPAHDLDYSDLALPMAFETRTFSLPSTAGQSLPGLRDNEGETYLEPIPSDDAFELFAPFAVAAPELPPMQ